MNTRMSLSPADVDAIKQLTDPTEQDVLRVCPHLSVMCAMGAADAQGGYEMRWPGEVEYLCGYEALDRQSA